MARGIAVQQRAAELVHKERVLCEIAAQTQAENWFLRAGQTRVLRAIAAQIRAESRFWRASWKTRGAGATDERHCAWTVPHTERH